MLIRSYEPADCETLAELFRRSVHAVCAGDYTPKQLDAWAPGRVDLAAWNRSFLEHHTLVAVEGDIVVGFGDMDRISGQAVCAPGFSTPRHRDCHL